MLIAIDIGNTNITIGLFRESELVSTWRFSTDSQKTSDEYGLLLKQVMSYNNVEIAQIDAATICSVVPPLTTTFESLCRIYIDVNPLTVVAGTKTGIKVLYDSPRDVGTDRIVDAAAAHHIYGGPCIIVDLGTATVFDAVNERAEYLGGAIAPGMIVSADSLYRATSQLRKVELNAPGQAIGKNTTHSIQSGLVFGYSELIKGMIARFKKELGTEATVIATGGQATIVKDQVGEFDYIDPDLTLKGLQIVHSLNIN
ncbi:MAG TPA: type III pantothenate kinase [SAR202 cluster bacterium]|jgi:type III pantothenate kinase|nr:type III pantothenate kinase [SAR202 cluster bacterium]|tara:strand:- start:385 stop:1152 length:768 start_codon:yes stop_codon:yes gene_type:complete